MQGTKFAGADKQQLSTLFTYLENCLEQIVKDNELGALRQALRGGYVEPGPGGDPIRNPGVLPTGKNIHALDPQSIPTQAAVKSARIVVERWVLTESAYCACMQKAWLPAHLILALRCVRGLTCWLHIGCWRRSGRSRAGHGPRLWPSCCGALTTSKPTESPSHRYFDSTDWPESCTAHMVFEHIELEGRSANLWGCLSSVWVAGQSVMEDLLLTRPSTESGALQVMMMVGVNPVSDALGRVNKLEVIPLEELGRPRVDVVVNCSGVFRDLFVNQMNLLDRAIKLAAEQDEPEEMNFVRKHARQQVCCVLSCSLHVALLFCTGKERCLSEGQPQSLLSPKEISEL